MSSGSGYDVFARIRSLLSFGSTTLEDNSLKRRAPEPPDHRTEPKYRRVSHAFHKMISKPFDDDAHFLQPRVVDCMNMSMKKSSEYPNYLNKPNKSQSANITYADLEYSDEEDDIIFSNPRSRPLNISAGTSAINGNSRSTRPSAYFPSDQISVFIRNGKPTVNDKSTSTVNGNISEKSSLFNSMIANHHDSWHKRLSAKSDVRLSQSKSIPALIEVKTGRLAKNDSSQLMNTSRKYPNGLVISDTENKRSDLKMGNGIGAAGKSKTSLPPPPQFFLPSTEKNSNSLVNKTYNLKERNGYMKLLQKIVPALYKSKNSEQDRQRLSQLADARDSTKSHSYLSKKKNKISANISLIDENEVQSKDIIDLSDDDAHMVSVCRKLQGASKIEETRKLPVVEPVNSLRDKLVSPRLQAHWIENIQENFNARKHLQKQQIAEEEQNVRKLTEETEQHEKLIEERLRNVKIDIESIVLDESESEEEIEFPELDDEERSAIKKALYRGPSDEVLVSKFSMNITRRDVLTLAGDTWLNDEIINFYMNLLMERSEERHREGLPRVYAMNTFFVPRLLQNGHSSVRRWTRKVDIFSYDVIPVPVHVGQVHWCMAIIHLRNKTIKYYDSMGTPNPRLLHALEGYLKEESLDKRKEPFDTSEFVKESVAKVPRQMNGSDCGVFSCMFAEYITRDREITFSQEHMSYFRQKMIFEIIQGKLLL